MNSVLTQEAEKFNILLQRINDDLAIFISTYKGTIVMTESMEAMANCFSLNKVPLPWT